MKRILHIVGGMNQGGTENFIMNLYRNIDRSKVQFDFLVNRDGFFDKEILDMGGKIYKIPALQKVGQILYVYNLSQFFKHHKGEYKVVHSHINKVSGLILKVANKNGIPVRIAHSHGTFIHNNFLATKYKEYLGEKILKHATHYFACSVDAAKFLFKEEYKKAYIINNGVDYDKFVYSETDRDYIRNKYNISDDSVIIGNIARFSTQKNHKFLIEIFNEYLKINKNSYLMLIGEGILEKDIRKQVEKLGITNNVIFIGITGEVNKYYSAFDAFLLPSLSEGLGIVLIEAQISGLNCYTSKDAVPTEARISEIIEFISLEKSAKDWAKHIKVSHDRNNKELSYSFNVKNVAKNLENFYLNEDTQFLKSGGCK